MSAAARIRLLSAVPTPLPAPAFDAGAAPTAPPPPREGVLVDVVVLTADLGLFHSAKEAIGERNPVWRARTAEEAADLLITGRCGVLLVDTASLSMRADTLIEQIVEQFPETVVCAAGTRDDEPLLAPLISAGLVYRFLHKPTSTRRAAMFLQAAIKRHLEHRDGEDDAARSLLRSFTRPREGVPRKYFVACAAICAALLSLLFLGDRPDTPTDPQPVLEPAPDPIPAATSDRADPVLSRARAALQAGRLEAPEGRNALDLFEAVLLAQPEHEEARDGLAKTIDLLVERARTGAAAGRKAEAERVLQRILAVDPQHENAKALVAKVNPPDLPSRQLAREQVAEVRLRELERTATTSAPQAMKADTSAGAVAQAPLPEPVSSAYLARTHSPQPATPVAIQSVVERDPLAPRYVNTPPPKRVASWRKQGTNDTAVNPVPPPVAKPIAAPAGPADEFERVVAPPPAYPEQARRQRINGWVELEFTISAGGAVSGIEVVGAHPNGVFERAATDALAQWRFRPRLVNGQPVAQRSSITLRFDVDD